jgi:hypothetical protein
MFDEMEVEDEEWYEIFQAIYLRIG